MDIYPYNKGYKVPKKSVEMIRQKTEVLRSFLGYSRNCPLDMSTFLEHDLHRKEVTVEILSDFEMEDKEGAAIPSDLLIMLSDRTYKNLCRGNYRAAFTVAHETGHVFLSHSMDFHLENPTQGARHLLTEDSEWQANNYAAELLMPLEGALECASAGQLARKFNVSFAAASLRRELLGEQGFEIKGQPKQQLGLPF